MSAETEQPATARSIGATGPYHSLRVARVIEETADARSFVLEIPDELVERFGYRAGQFLTFRVSVDGDRLVRCYSLASSPDAEREHKVTVKRIEDGRVSNWVNDHLTVGDSLEAMRPAGVFCLSDRATPVVLFGAGSGITPVISLLKSVLVSTSRRVELVYANRDRESIIFRRELDDLAARYPERLRLVHRLDSESGFIDREDVLSYIGECLDADFYVCGPTEFMDTVEGTLGDLGIDPRQVFVERFVSLSDGDSSPAAASGRAREDGDAVPAVVAIALDGERREVPYVAGQTLLASARAAGFEPPFACEEGYCSCCMAKLAKGTVRMLANDALDDDQVAEGWVLTCQSIPTAEEIEVEYPD